jgi:hemolysin activation/secretion protein
VRYSIKLISFLLSLLLLSSAQAETLHFPINQFLIQGNTLVSNEAIAELTRPFTGDSRVYGDIQKALEAIENAYRKAGYGAVQVYAPEQDVTSGFVQLNVTESKLANIVTEFTEHFDRDSILASLPTLEIGKSPNTRAISNNIQLVNENPAKKIEVIMGAGDKEDTINATIKVREENPVGIILTADNSGKPIAGEHKIGASIQHANLWGKKHVGTISYMTSPELSDKIKVISAGYRIPFFKTNSSLDLVVAKSDSDLTVASNLQSLGNINIIGRSETFARIKLDFS